VRSSSRSIHRNGSDGGTGRAADGLAPQGLMQKLDANGGKVPADLTD
jgi:hypothetical protein